MKIKYFSILLSLCIVSNFTYSHDNILKTVSDPYCPYTCEPGSDAEGYMTEIVKTIFEKQDYHVEYTAVTWARALKDTKTGKADVLLGLYIEDAPDLVFPEENIGTLFMSFFASSESAWNYDSLASVNGRKIGLILDYAYNDAFDAYILKPENHVEVSRMSGVDTVLRRSRMVTKGYLDAFLEDKYVVRYALRHDRLLKKMKEAGLLEKEGHAVYVAFSPAHPARSNKLTKIFDEGFKALKGTDEFTRITEKYGIDYW